MNEKYLALVEACASSANLGPGYDRAAIALNIFNRYRAVGFSKDFELRGWKSKQPVNGGQSLVVKAVMYALEASGVQDFKPLAIEGEQNIIPGAGMGSSAAEIVGGIMLASRVYGLGWSREKMLDMALKLEYHPDNLSAALGGGMVVCYRQDGSYRYQKIAIWPHLEVLLFIPHQEVVTEEARHLIPELVPVADAADNIANFCLLAEALRKGDIGKAARFIGDRIHQPYRAKIYPESMKLVKDLRDKHGIPAAISGSGPAVIAFDLKDSPKVEGMEPNGFRIVKTSINFNGSRYL